MVNERAEKPFARRSPAYRLVPEELSIVSVNETGVECRRAGEPTQSVRWDELQQVMIVTNDAGPWACDVYWLLTGNRSQCIIPQGASNEDALLEVLYELPGIDFEQIILAMTSVENQHFVCWKRE